ncbi:hypothetical protein Hdeb2414_s0006g00196891 [Helianthus debilis subsp. tardiflorus]
MSVDSNSGPGSDLSIQLANLLKNGLNPQPQNPKLSDHLQINLKLNSQNYALWTRMIRVAIGGKSKTLLSHLTSGPPDQNSEEYEQWEQEDLIVFSWLIQNIEPVLVGNLTEYPTAKTLWDALVVTYSSGRDKLQTFNLHVKANDIKQGDNSLEDFWIALQGIWGEIDRIDPNPMKCPEDIKTYSKIRRSLRLCSKRSRSPVPGATINNTQGIAAGLMVAETEGVGLVTKGRQFEGKNKGPSGKEDKTHLKCDHCGMNKHTREQCFRLVGYPDWWADGHKKGTRNQGPERGKVPTTVNTKDTGETSSDRKNPTGFGGMAAAFHKEEDEYFSSYKGTGGERIGVSKPSCYFSNIYKQPLEESKPPFLPNICKQPHEVSKLTTFLYFLEERLKNCKMGPSIRGLANMAQNYNTGREQSWIFDYGATDTMTYDLLDFATSTKPTKSYIHTANGEK